MHRSAAGGQEMQPPASPLSQPDSGGYPDAQNVNLSDVGQKHLR